MPSKKLSDSELLDKLIELCDQNGGFDNEFDQILFFSKGKKAKTQYRNALKEWIKRNKT